MLIPFSSFRWVYIEAKKPSVQAIHLICANLAHTIFASFLHIKYGPWYSYIGPRANRMYRLCRRQTLVFLLCDSCFLAFVFIAFHTFTGEKTLIGQSLRLGLLGFWNSGFFINFSHPEFFLSFHIWFLWDCHKSPPKISFSVFQVICSISTPL